MADFYVDLFGDKKVYTKDGKEVTKDTKIKKKTGFFQTPALFDDGYQFGDITGTILGTAVDTVATVGKGAGRFVEGMGDSVLYGASEVADFLGADSADKWLKGVANTNLIDNAFAPIDDTFGRASIWGDTSSSVLEGVGQVGAMISIGRLGKGLGFGALGTTALTSGSMFTSSLGSGISEAYQNGATDGEAWAYGTMKGGIDAATEMLFGGLGKAVKAVGLSRGISSLDDIFARKASSKISNHVLKNAVQYGIKASGEGLEEVLAGYGTAVAKKLTYASDEELEKLVKDENLLEQFIVGAMTSGIVQSPQLYHSAKTGTDFVTGYTKSEESVVEAVVQERVKELESEGKKVSKREISKIYDDVKNSLEKGYIDTDKIESIIGGDAYKNYKDLEKKLEEAEKEYDKYHNMPHGEKTDAIDARQKELASEIESLKKQVSEARESLFRTLDDGIKGTRLSESYREGVRASEKFEADLSQYENEFAKKTIENYMARNFNNTNRSHDRADFMAKLAEDRGRVYGFTTTAELEASIKEGNPYGIKEGTDVSKIEALESEKNGVILVNMDANKSFNSLIGHETTHTMEKAGLYGDLQEAVFDLAKSRGEYDDRLESIRRRYANLSEDEQMKELTADLLGDYIFASDPEFVMKLSTERPNLFKRILEEIKHLFKLATSGSDEARQLENARHLFEKAWRDRGSVSTNTKAETKLSSADSDKTYLDAVNRGDMETAQKMVDEVAKANGYDTGYLVWRGDSDNYNVLKDTRQIAEENDWEIDEFDDGGNLGYGLYFTPNRPYAEQMAGRNGILRKFYLKTDYADLTDSSVKKVLAEILKEYTDDYGFIDRANAFDEFVDVLGKDGIKAFGVSGVGFGAEEIKVLESWQAKLADAVTYDDNGNVIPLSERFNAEESDIRYSLASEYEKMPKTVETTEPTQAVLRENTASVRDVRRDVMRKNQYSEYEVKQINKFMDDMAKFMEKAGVTYKYIGLEDVKNAKLKIVYDKNGKPQRITMSAMVANGDYPINFDFSSICKKRQSMSMVIKELASRKGANGERLLDTVNLDAKALWKINEELRKAGLETACLGCFVESKRYNVQNFANKATKMWNTIVDEVRAAQGKTSPAENFNFADGIDLESVNYNEISEVFEAYEQVKERRSPEQRMRALITSGGDLYQRYLQPSDIMTPEGIEGMKALSTNDYNMFGIVKGAYGQAAPKEVMGFSPYNSEVALLPDEVSVGGKKRKLAEYIASIGGVRMQSFSDFIIANVYDYMQMVADLSARHLPAHAYTKEISFAKIFGLTGIKINLSVMFDIDPNLPNEYAGLRFVPDVNGDAEYNGTKGRFEYLIGDKKRSDSVYNETGERPYVQSIGFDEAVELQNTEGYSKNVGIVGVGFSKNHILKMLDDNNIRYIIPYHTSSLPEVIKSVTHISKATDYTSFQNTRKKSGEKLTGLGGFDIYKDVEMTQNPRETADNYLMYCATNGYIPVFEEFAFHDNYYKVLFDFDPYDTITGEYSPQTEVKNVYKGYNPAEGNLSTSEVEQIIDDEMNVQNEANKRRNDMLPGVVDSVLKQLGIQNDQASLRIADDDLYTPKTYGDGLTAKDMLVKDIGPTVETAQTPSTAEDIAPTVENGMIASETSATEIAPLYAAQPNENVIDGQLSMFEEIPVKKSDEAVKSDSKKSRPEQKQRKWVGTSTESEVVDGKVLPKDLDQDLIHYQPIPNKKTLGNANASLERMGYDTAVQYFNSQFENKKVSLDDIALGERLIQEAVKREDYETASNLIQNVSILGTELGQKVQALSIIKRLSPEGQLKMLQKTVERGKAKGDKAFEGVEITQEMIDHILKTYGKDGTYDQKKLNKAVEEVKQKIADQMKVTPMEKANAWRYLSMLGNPKTHIRNLVSNVAMRGTLAVKNAVARTIEGIAPIKNRTKTWKASSDAVNKFAELTTNEMKDEISGNSKYSDDASIKQKREIFKNKILNGVYEFNSNMLEKEDWWFSKKAFKESLAEYLTANGIVTEQDIAKNPKIVAKAKAYALEQAQIATFRQYSWLANKINEMEKKNTATSIAVGAILPFKKTPVNIAKAGLSYSPLGFMKTLTYDIAQVKKGNMEASELVDHLSQNVTGTALTLVGYMLASSGLLSGGGEDDKEGKYDYQLGEQAYSVNIGGNSYSLSWLSPVAMPLFVGANAYEQLVEGKEWNGDVVVETLSQTLDPLSEMSFLSSLDDVLSSYDSGVEKFAGIAESMAQNYITQFAPTIMSQVATVTDDKKRSTKVGGDSGFKFFDETINKLKYKIPGLRQTLEPSTDIWGNEVTQTENLFGRAFETFIAPYSKRENIATDIDEEIKSVYRETGDNGIIPSVPYNYTNYGGEKYKMSESEYTQYKQTYGQTASSLLDELFGTETYKASTSEDKAKMINDVYDYAADEAKRELLAQRGIDYTNAESSGTRYYRENPIKGAIEMDISVDEYNFSTANPEKYAFFKDNGMYDKYASADEEGKRAYNWAYENPGKYEVSKVIADNVVEYRQYTSGINDVRAYKDKNGKTIPGSAKGKKIAFINGLDLDYGQKIILYRSEYSSDDTYNNDIVEYLNNREDISYDEMVTILKELGFSVSSDGTVSW